MSQNQCVPNWDLYDFCPTPLASSLIPRSPCNSLSVGHDTFISLDYEVAELKWENGHLTMLGLGEPRTPSRNNLEGAFAHTPSTRSGGTLEFIVNQGTHKLSAPPTLIGACDYHNDIVPATVAMGMDAVVPSDSNRDIGLSMGGVGCSTRVGSCSSAAACVPQYSDWSVSGSEGDQMKSMTTYGVTSNTSFGASLDNTAMTSALDDLDHDSACHSVPQREKVEDDDDNNEKKGTTKSISSMRRGRTAATHNKSEKKRRDKINQRMKTLQKMVPNSNETNQALMLDEVIDYMKQLQAQVRMFNTMRLPSMMMTPLALQQQFQMSMMASMGVGMGLGMGMNMDQMNMTINNAMGYPNNILGLPLSILNPTAYMSFAAPSVVGDCEVPQADPLSTYLACQSHPITMDAYNRTAATYQHFQQQPSHNQGAGRNTKR